MQEQVAVHILEDKGGVVRQTIFGMAGQLRIGNLFKHAADDLVTQRLDVRDSLSAFLLCQPQRLGKPDDVRHVLRPRAQAELLPAARQVRDDLRPLADVQRADSLRPIEFVRAEREHVHAEGLHVHIQICGGLHRVRVEKDTALAADGGQLSNRVDRANLVVGEHHRCQRGRVTDGRAHRVRRDHAPRVHGKPFDLDTIIFFELFGGLADGVMLDTRGQQPGAIVFPSRERSEHRAAQGEVVRFGAAGGEDDFVGAAVQHGGNRLARGVDRGFGNLSETVNRRRVPE